MLVSGVMLSHARISKLCQLVTLELSQQPGASETASYQGAGEGEVDVLSEAEGGAEGCQIKVQREGISNFPHIGKSEIHLQKSPLKGFDHSQDGWLC